MTENDQLKIIKYGDIKPCTSCGSSKDKLRFMAVRLADGVKFEVICFDCRISDSLENWNKERLNDRK